MFCVTKQYYSQSVIHCCNGANIIIIVYVTSVCCADINCYQQKQCNKNKSTRYPVNYVHLFASHSFHFWTIIMQQFKLIIAKFRTFEELVF